MYTSQELAIAIKKTAKNSNAVLKTVFEECGLNSNTMSALYHDKSIAFDSLAKIADNLDCSVDYLLGRTNDPQSHKAKSSNSVNGNYNAVDNSSVSISTSILDDHQKLLIELYNQLSPIEQVNLISKLSNVNNKTSTDMS